MKYPCFSGDQKANLQETENYTQRGKRRQGRAHTLATQESGHPGIEEQKEAAYNPETAAGVLTAPARGGGGGGSRGKRTACTGKTGFSGEMT